MSRSNRITAAPAVPARPAANPGGAVAKPINDTAVPAAPGVVPGAPARPHEDVMPGLADALRAVAPGADHKTWLPALQTAMDRWQVNTPNRVAAALGQFVIEAGSDLRELAENLTYTTADRICIMFKDEFATPAEAEAYCRAPEKLANRAYANKLGNGDVASGDGWRYRGRGLIQLTGRMEYAAFAAAMDMSLEQAMAWCETPPGGAMSGCWYLHSRGCLELADMWRLDSISEKVNGAYCKTKAERRDASDRARQAMERLGLAA